MHVIEALFGTGEIIINVVAFYKDIDTVGGTPRDDLPCAITGTRNLDYLELTGSALLMAGEGQVIRVNAQKDCHARLIDTTNEATSLSSRKL